MSTSRKDRALRPSEGARYLFELEPAPDGREHAVYRAAIYTPAQCFEYRADMQIGGSVELVPRGAAATAELEARLLAMAKLIARDAGKRLEDRLDPWPRRVLRWRGQGRG